MVRRSSLKKCVVTDNPRLFLIDGIISLPVAISGFFVLPDVPEISNPWYLSKKVSPYNVSHYLVLKV